MNETYSFVLGPVAPVILLPRLQLTVADFAVFESSQISIPPVPLRKLCSTSRFVNRQTTRNFPGGFVDAVALITVSETGTLHVIVSPGPDRSGRSMTTGLPSVAAIVMVEYDPVYVPPFVITSGPAATLATSKATATINDQTRM